MRKITKLALAAGAAVGIGSMGSATPADAGGWCPPVAYTVVYYAPPPCCGGYMYGQYSYYYYKTTQYWPVARTYRARRPALYGPIRAKRR